MTIRPGYAVGCLTLVVWAGCLSCVAVRPELQVMELSSPTSVRLNSIAVVDDSVVYACGGIRYDLGVLLCSRDAGLTWQQINTLDLRKELFALWLFSADTLVMANYDGLICRSENGGDTWSTNQPRFWKPVRDFHFYDARHGWACGGEGFQNGVLHFSTDGGANWIADTFEIELRDLHFFDARRGLAAGYGAILFTDDGGASWQRTNAKRDFFVGFSFPDQYVGYAAGFQGSVWKTLDGGQTWQRLRNGNSLLEPQRHFNRIAFRSRNVGYLVGPNGCFLKTQDGGQSWKIAARLPRFDVEGIALTADGGFLCGSNGRLFRFFDP